MADEQFITYKLCSENTEKIKQSIKEGFDSMAGSFNSKLDAQQVSISRLINMLTLDEGDNKLSVQTKMSALWSDYVSRKKTAAAFKIAIWTVLLGQLATITISLIALFAGK